MNYPAAQLGLNVIILLINVGIFFYTYKSNRDKVTNDRFKVLEERMIKAEGKIERMPVCGNHDRMESNDSKLFQRFDELHGDIRQLVGSVTGLTNSLGLINQHLLNGGR